MPVRSSFLVAIALLLACSLSASAAEAKLPRVLLFGDSVCNYYSPYVKDLFKDQATVVFNGSTWGDTRNAIKNLPAALLRDGGHWDVIHFNWGLHDIKNHIVVPIDEYEKSLRECVKILKATHARLVWGSITPVGRDTGNAGDRLDSNVVAYNAVARKVMEENGIPIDDLYAAVKPKIAELQKPDGVHFEDSGCKVLAKSVFDSIVAVVQGKKVPAPK